MSSKRKFSEYRADASAAGETRRFAPSNQNSYHKKKKGPSKETPTSINRLKKRARTIERRLNRDDSLPANVKHELEKELDHHKQKLEDLVDGKKRNAMITKYHMVRFFERKKADRLAKKIRTQLEATTDEEEKKKLQTDLHIAEIDSLYARYFPHRERYVSLYPATSLSHKGVEAEDRSTAVRSLHTERPPLWDTIEQTSKKGIRALVQIQERKSALDSKSRPSQERPSKHSSREKGGQRQVGNAFTLEPKDHQGKRQQLRGSPDPNNDDESDGGFFEEG